MSAITVSLDVALVVVAYFIGAIPVGLLIARWQGGIDLRRYGSGSTGATNVLRALGWKASALVFLLDLLKSIGAVYLAWSMSGSAWIECAAGVAAIVGHCWPIYLGGTGGRGATSSLGGLFVIDPIVATGCFVVAILAILRTRYASAGSLAGAVFGGVVMAALVATGHAPLGDVIYVLGSPSIVFIRHRENIRRLIAGTERRIGDKGDSAPAPTIG
jgi:glycerol-3-phosphate acyltransferase PlsY